MFVATDKDGDEYIYEEKPIKCTSSGSWVCKNEIDCIEVPKGTIQRLLNYPLTWEDDCQEIVEYKDKDLKEDKMIKQNIKMRVTPEQSKKVQDICFENGIYWAGYSKVIHTESIFLYIDGILTHDSNNNEQYFKEEGSEEIDADLFIRTNGTCEDAALNDDKMIKRNIKMRVTPEQLEKICKIVGEGWLYFKSAIYMYIFNDGLIEVSYSKENWNKYNLQEIDADLFIRTNGTCEDAALNDNSISFEDKEYIKLEKKVFNLKKQLEKYVIKIANQKEEITRLLLQKERLQQMLMMPCKSVDNNNLVKLLEEKDAIIKYLENKLEI